MTSAIKVKQSAFLGIVNVSDMNDAVPNQSYTAMLFSCITGTNAPADDGPYWGFAFQYDSNAILQAVFGRYHSYHRYCVWGTWENWITMS